MTSLLTRAQAVLTRLAGQAAVLHRDQARAIEALVAKRRRVLLVQRTGFGKSAVYFVATRLLRDQGAGPTVIVSPLLALMRNQIDAAKRAGINATTVNSSNTHEWDEIFAAVAADEVDVLLVSPERLNNPEFRDLVLPKLAAAAGMLVVDEAHCISDWGHDFRPDYRRLKTFLEGLSSEVPVLATTATANARVSADVAEQLAPGGEALVLRGGLDRDSLSLSVVDLDDNAARLAWLDTWLPKLPASGIIYSLTVSGAADIADHLRARGHTVAAYSGQTDTTERHRLEDDLLAGRVKALVATSALGMGFDKPDLGFVVHVGAPPSPVAYYQQVGRAGRAREHADVVLLPGREDVRVWRYFASLAFPGEDVVRQTLAALAEAGRPLSTAALESRVDLRRNRLDMMLKVLDVDGAVRRVKGGWEVTGRDWVYDRDRYARVAHTREAEQQRMLDYAATGQCRMTFLRTELDDPADTPCGRCDNCAGRRFDAPLPAGALHAAATTLNRPGVPVEPRRMWPTGMSAIGVDVSGKIPPDRRAETGRVLGRLSDIGWGGALRSLFGKPDAAVDDAMFNAVVEVLAAWDWPKRPRIVVSTGSRSRPTLVDGLARRIAHVGRMDYAGALTRDDRAPSRTGTTNSAQRLRQVYGTFTIGFPIPAGADILLVDDLRDSGWTATVAARALRNAGAASVCPFALALDG